MSKMKGAAGAAVVVAVLLGACGWTIGWQSTNATQTCTVDKEDRTTNSRGHSDVRVYTRDCGVFSVADDGLRLHFNSAGVYGSIESGKRYQFTTVGFRFPLLSDFPNILDAKPAS